MTVAFETLRFEIDGVETVVKAIGQGPTLLYLHGAATLEGFDFAAGLADRFRVLCPSHPGFGFSGDAPDVSGMTDMVLHYLNLLDRLALPEPPHLMGFSMGGWMASELAGLAPERFGKVVLVSPAGLNDPAYPATDLAAVQPQALPAYLSHDPSVALGYFPDGSDEAAAQRFGADRAREGAAVGRLTAPFGMGHPNLARFLRRIRQPALVVWGTNDRLLPAGQADLWAAALPDAHVLLEEGAGHLILQERPDVLQRIGDFLDEAS
ncbi:alpha/beta hydrolase [Aureimonas ureilytica]|uniref:Alpha/beta hydrolase n=1 Tax=Aureimonas ureilytica TaxID=401562 RepID=A0A175RD17_9HYPH|nr:alpha/beta hydrolase [Aureimonas ureilytica]KTQ97019.1 alpha/beta hydrolase [Aureimonas ureilytica]